MTGLGAGEIIGGPGIGFLVDKIGSKSTALINAVLVILSVGVTLVVLNVNASIPLLCTMTFLWGIHDGSLSSHTCEMLGFQFDSKMEPFSIYNLNKSLMVFIFSLIQSYVNVSNEALTIYFSVIGVFGALMCFNTYFFDFKYKARAK